MKNVITEIEVQKKNKNRVNIYINDEYAFSCSSELVYIHSLKKNMEVKLDYLDNIINDDNYLKCKDCALNIIEKAYKTESEIIKKLTQKGYNIKTIDKVLVFLRKYNFIDDDRYVDMFIKENISKNGKIKIKYKLLKKGIKEELLNNKLHSISEQCEINNAYNLAEKKFKTLVKNEDNIKSIYKKIGNYLVSNGYSFQIINNVLPKVVKTDMIKSIKIDEPAMDNNLNEENNNIKNTAQKRYNIIIKSEEDSTKIYRRLYSYLLRRGFESSAVKKILNEIVK